MRTISMREFESHKETAPNELWILIDGYVYDMAKFAKFHPGGQAILEHSAGKDVSREFANFHGSHVMRKHHEKWLVGEIANRKPKETFIVGADPSWIQLNGHSPYYNESHRAWQKHVRAFVDRELLPNVVSWQNDSKPPADLMAKMGEEGFLAVLCGSPYPVDYLPSSVLQKLPRDLDTFHELILIDEMSRCAHGGAIAAITNGPSIALSAVLRFGNDEQKRKVVPGVLSGAEFIALAISEPQAGSDVAGLTCVAEKKGSSYFITGLKKWITNGMYADWFVLAARTGGERHSGLSFLLVSKDAPNFSTRKINIRESGISGTALLNYQKSEVPASSLLGEEGKGFQMIMHNFNHERWYISAIALRLSRICLEESIRYAKVRMAFGKPISALPTLQQKVGEMSQQVEMLQAWVEKVTYLLKSMPKRESDAKINHEICLLKGEASKVLELCAHHTTAVFGGNSLHKGGVADRIEGMVLQVKAYSVPAGEENVMTIQGGKTMFKMSKL